MRIINKKKVNKNRINNNNQNNKNQRVLAYKKNIKIIENKFIKS